MRRASQGCLVRGGCSRASFLDYQATEKRGSAGKERKLMGLSEISHRVMLWEKKRKPEACLRRAELLRARVELQRDKRIEECLRGEQGWASWPQVWAAD